MEIRKTCVCALLILVFTGMSAHAQFPAHGYTIKEGRMYISLTRNINIGALDSFMSRYNLNAIGLFQYIRTRSMDSLKKLGWRLEEDKPMKFIISKPLLSSGYIGNPAGQIILTEKHPTIAEMFPAVNNGLAYGYNLFRRKMPFAQNNGWVTVYLRGNTKATREALITGRRTVWP
jgi:hypothetical protein